MEEIFEIRSCIEILANDIKTEDMKTEHINWPQKCAVGHSQILFYLHKGFGIDKCQLIHKMAKNSLTPDTTFIK